MDKLLIRNFCIIAHIDHGKSTLADRLLEKTNTISTRDMSEQFLDQMDLEKERGITIKAQAVRMNYRHGDDVEYQLNLIDTPGHVDFSYEVSRSLQACEGAILVVDATQGIQAQTLANVYVAIDRELEIIPVVNKIDAPLAETDRVVDEMVQAFGFDPQEVLRISAKTGAGVLDLLGTIIDRVPPPAGDPLAPLRALIFDSTYDQYKGVVAYVRVRDGTIQAGLKGTLMASGARADVQEVGIFRPHFQQVISLEAGEVGYIATGLKNIRDCRVGDTITLEAQPAKDPLSGNMPSKPLVFAGLYPTSGNQYPSLREALQRLQLNDASLSFLPETSLALGAGFRCGFLGLLHMEIVQERLEREYGLDLIITAPSVSYEVLLANKKSVDVGNPGELPLPHEIAEIKEPWLKIRMVTPSRFIGPMLELIQNRRGQYGRLEYLSSYHGDSSPTTDSPSLDPRVLIEFDLPLSELLHDLYDQVKSKSQGYTSLDYDFSEYRAADLVRLDLLINELKVDSLSMIVPRERAFIRGKALVRRLKEVIPRQLFEVPIQAAIGSRVLARETVPALRKDVLAKLYGGDVTRKMKLLEKQAAGKKRMKRIGKVELPQEAFLAILKVN